MLVSAITGDNAMRLSETKIDRKMLYPRIFIPLLLVVFCFIISCVSAKPSGSSKPSANVTVKDSAYYEQKAAAILKARPLDKNKLKKIIDEGLARFPQNATLWSHKASYHLANKSGSPDEAKKALYAARKRWHYNRKTSESVFIWG